MKCTGARILVWSGIGALVILLILALSALDERNEAVGQLQKAIDELASKDQDYDQAKAYGSDLEQQRERLQGDLASKESEAERLSKEADRQREKARNNMEFDILHRLQSMDRVALEDQMHKDAQTLWALVDGVKAATENDEPLNKLLTEFREQGNLLRDAFDRMRVVIDDGVDEGDDDVVEAFEMQVEEMENLGLQLEHHAKAHPSAWQNPGQAGDISHYITLLDIDVEAFDGEMDQEHLAADEAELKRIDELATDVEGEEDPFAQKVRDEERKLEGMRKRVYDEIGENDEDEELDAAEALEEEAEEAEAALEGYEEDYIEGDQNLNSEQMERRRAMDKAYKDEVYKLEEEAADIEEDLERRAIRHDEQQVEKAGAHLKEQGSFQKLQHAGDAVSEVAKIDELEEKLMQELRKKDPSEAVVDQLSRQIEAETDALDDDAERLWNEADAADIDDMDEKEMDKQIARQLEDAAQREHRDVEEAADDLHQREVRERAEHIQGDVNRIRSSSLKREHAKGFKEKAEQLNRDADFLNRQIGENDDLEEDEALAKVEQDIKDVESEEKLFEQEARDDKEENEKDTQEDVKLGQEVNKEADLLEEEAKRLRENSDEERAARAKLLRAQLKSVEYKKQNDVIG